MPSILWITYGILFVLVIVFIIFSVKRKPSPIQKRHIVRQAEIKDLDNIMLIINDAKDLHEQIGLDQWSKASPYPAYTDFLRDINAKSLYVYDYGDEIIGVAAIIAGEDPNYKSIFDGQWLVSNGKYLTIHRIATKKEYYHKGVAKTLISFAKSQAKQKSLDSVRIDTHINNVVMNQLLQKNGFSKCGKIYLNNDNTRARIVYEIKI